MKTCTEREREREKEYEKKKKIKKLQTSPYGTGWRHGKLDKMVSTMTLLHIRVKFL